MSVPSVNGAVLFGRVQFKNQLLFPRGLYPPIQVPVGITVYDAMSASMADMINLGTQRRRRYQYHEDMQDILYRFPAGYTYSDLAVRFIDFDRQWQRDGSFWRYRGGRICLDVTIAVYADERAANKPRCWAMILEHELLHAADEVNIAKDFLPRAAARAPFVRSEFQVPIPDREFQARIRGDGSGEGSEFEQRIQRSLWIPESSKRAKQVHDNRPDDGQAIRNCIAA